MNTKQRIPATEPEQLPAPGNNLPNAENASARDLEPANSAIEEKNLKPKSPLLEAFYHWVSSRP